MVLSKAFDSLNHNLLLTKFKAYEVCNNSVEFFHSLFLTDTNVVK